MLGPCVHYKMVHRVPFGISFKKQWAIVGKGEVPADGAQRQEQHGSMLG